MNARRPALALRFALPFGVRCALTCGVLLALATAALPGSAAAQGADPFARPPGPVFSVTIPLPVGGRGGGQRRLTNRQLAEMGAVVLTGVGHLVASANGVSGAYIPVVIGGWGGYVGYRAVTEPGFLADAGFTADELGPAFRDASLLAGGATVAMLIIGAAQGTLRFEADMLPLLVLYPAWGLTQQFLVQGLVTRHLADAGLSAWVVTPVSAATFGSVHLPDLPLTAATTGLGAAYATLYQRHRNLWPLGLYHGVLGAEFYVWVLGRNPWEELTGGTADGASE